MPVEDPRVPARSLARALAAAGHDAGFVTDPPGPATADGEAEAAWRDAAEASGLVDGLREPEPPGPRGAGKNLAAALTESPARPDPRNRAPHPVGPPSPASVRAGLGGVPDRVLVLPARTGRLAAALLELGADEVLAHEPDPRLRRDLAARAQDRPGLQVRDAPATELGYNRAVDAVVADRPLYATRSLVGVLGRLHHALVPGGTLVLADVLRDEARDPATPGNRLARSLQVELRARGRDLLALQDLWRLLVETGYQAVESRRDPPARRILRASR